MNPNDPTWDDTGFEPENEDNSGFAPEESQAKSEPAKSELAKPELAKPEPGNEQSSEPESVPYRRTVQSSARQAADAKPTANKKKRSGLFWFATLAAGVLLIAVIGGGIYWMSQPSTEEQAFVAPANESPAVTVPSENSIPENSTTDTTRELESAESQAVPEHDQNAIAALEGDNSRTRELENSKPVVEKSRTRELENSKPVAKPEQKPEAKPERKPEREPVVKSGPKPAKVVPPPQEVRQPTGSKTALYVVQVFSSPSRDDADEWLQLLRGKNVADGYITEQKIKGQSWYRVRFGQYTTRESAESEALRLGFKEPWIARVR